MSEKLYRYMSVFEFIKMSQGLKIQSLLDHSNTNRTSSKGICFFGDKSFDDKFGSPHIPEDFIWFISGIVSNDVLVEFETTNQAVVNESLGIYSDGEHIEYWMDDYDNKVLVPLRYKMARGHDIDELEWKKYNEREIINNPKSIIKQIAERTIEKEDSLKNIRELCTMISSAIPGNDGWYIEINGENRNN